MYVRDVIHAKSQIPKLSLSWYVHNTCAYMITSIYNGAVYILIFYSQYIRSLEWHSLSLSLPTCMGHYYYYYHYYYFAASDFACHSLVSRRAVVRRGGI